MAQAYLRALCASVWLFFSSASPSARVSAMRKYFQLLVMFFIYLVFNTIQSHKCMPMTLCLSCFCKYHALCRRNLQTYYRSSRAGQPQA